MQFIERVSSIGDDDKVLEIGPGGNPHPRADVYLELAISEEELAAQRGHADKPELNGKIVYYDGNNFPFGNKDFDYVICSHVIEHVDDVESFIGEMFRVAKRGYIEYPTIYYEYLYNFAVHKNFIKANPKKDILYYLPKSKTPLDSFAAVQEFYYMSLTKGYDDLVVALKPYMFEGFEWLTPFAVRSAKDLSVICQSGEDISRNIKLPETNSRRRIIRQVIKKIGLQ